MDGWFLDGSWYFMEAFGCLGSAAMRSLHPLQTVTGGALQWQGHARLTPPNRVSSGVLRGFGPTSHWGMRLLDKIMIVKGVKPTIQHLGVGYVNRPKRGGGAVRHFAYLRSRLI